MIAKQKIHQSNNFMGAFDYNDRKMENADPSQRAELLDHNFVLYNRDSVAKEIVMLGKLRPNMTRDAYHVSLNFAKSDSLNNEQLVSLTQEYLKGMGFNENLYAIWKHNDADHLHVHALASRIKFDGSVVSDSNNYKRSEALCRKLEEKYGLQRVQSSKAARDRAPCKDELEMMQRTGQASNRMLMQEKVKSALAQAESVGSFIANCEKQGVYLLFNQSKNTGRVSGITYVMDRFIAKGQRLGNGYKWNSINQKLQYEQSRDGETVRQTNDRTRARFEDLLTQRESRNKKGNSATKSGTEYPKAGHYGHQERWETAGSGDSPSRTFSDKESLSENENTDRDFLSHAIGSLLSSSGGVAGGVSHSDVDDEDELKRKRRRRRP